MGSETRALVVLAFLPEVFTVDLDKDMCCFL